MGSSASKRLNKVKEQNKVPTENSNEVEIVGVQTLPNAKQCTVKRKIKDTDLIPTDTGVIKIQENTTSFKNTFTKSGSSKLKDPQTLRVFFSSPFGGMEGEREELTKIYLPQIRHLCTLKGIQFVAVDMRWGITVESADNAQVISICLRELDRSDLFVGFFGQRYGWHGPEDAQLQKNFERAMSKYPWLEKFRDRSVTELEFLHGHLNNAGALPAYICFRDKAYDDVKREEGMRNNDESLTRKYCAESEHSTLLMDDLKRRVKLTENRCLGINMGYPNPQEAIWNHVTNVLLVDTQTLTQSQREIDLSHHDAFIASRSVLYLGGEDYTHTLNDFVYRSTEHRGLLVRGESGSGKSAVLANWIRSLQGPSCSLIVLYHFVGCSEASTSVPNILRRLCSEALHLMADEPMADYENADCDKNDVISLSRYWLGVFETALTKLTHSGVEVVVVIDGLNRVEPLGKTAKPLFWIPALPRGVHMIISTLTSDTVTSEHLVSHRVYQYIDIQPLSETTQEQFCKRVLKNSGKELSADQLGRVVRVEQTHNPLYLRIFLEELCMFGDFWKLDERIDDLISSPNVRELFDKFLVRLDQDYNTKDHEGNIVEEVLCCLSVSHYGLSEAELMSVATLTSHQWSPLYFALEKYLINRAGLLTLGFDELKSAINERYMTDTNQRDLYIRKLITYFEEQKKRNCSSVTAALMAASARPTHELPHLYIVVSDWSGLAHTLANLVMFNRLQEEGKKYELLEMWKLTGLSGSEIADCYIKSLDDAVVCLERNSDAQQETPALKLYKYLSPIDDMLDLGDYLHGREKVLLYSVKLLEMAPDDNLNRDRLTAVEYSLGCLYVNMQSYDQAGLYHMRVLETRQKKVDGAGSSTTDGAIVDLATSCHGVGILHLKTHDYDKAQEFLLKSKALHEKVSTGRQSRVVTCVQNLGNVALSKNNYQPALEYFLQALKMYEGLYTHQIHHDIAYIQTNIAICYRKLDHLDQAEDYYQRSLKNKIKTLGEDHPSVALAYMNLGTLEVYRGNTDLQEKYSQMAVDIYNLNGTPDTQEQVIFARENLVNVKVTLGKMEECLPYYWKTLDANVQNVSLSRSLAIIHVKVAGYLIAQSRYDDARRIVNEVVKVPSIHSDVTMIQLHYLDGLLDQRPVRDDNLSIDSALVRWPYSMSLLGYKATQDLVPAGDIDALILLLRKACDSPEVTAIPDMFTTAAGWCPSQEMMLRVFELALEVLPHNKVFLANAIMSLKEIGRISDAVPYALDLHASSSDEFRYQMFAAETLCLADKLTEAQDLMVEMRLQWSESEECLEKIDTAMMTVESILNEADTDQK